MSQFLKYKSYLSFFFFSFFLLFFFLGGGGEGGSRLLKEVMISRLLGVGGVGVGRAGEREGGAEAQCM